MSKDDMINLLIYDFVKMFPDHKPGEIINLRMKLSFFDIEDLELLVSQCEL